MPFEFLHLSSETMEDIRLMPLCSLSTILLTERMQIRKKKNEV